MSMVFFRDKSWNIVRSVAYSALVRALHEAIDASDLELAGDILCDLQELQDPKSVAKSE